MTKNKRVELKTNFINGHVSIIDWVESKQKDAICIFNDLGVLPFSSAPSLCKLLNELNDEVEFLEIENESLEDGATRYAESYHESLKENEELKEQLADAHDLNSIYVDFLVDKGFELSDVIKWSKEVGIE